MRLSCNGCRVLRRGCCPNCPIRTSLNWIKSPLSQSNATLFLAKFYGRQALFNLLTTAPSHLQPAVFKSLLYEACGRMVNPVFGSTGLLSTGNWHLCEAAVEAVLNGAPIQQAPSDGSVSLQFQDCDIRHVAKSGKSSGSEGLDKVRSRTSQFKRRATKPKVESVVAGLARFESELDGSVSRDSGSGSGSGLSEHKSVGDSNSVESAEPIPTDDGQMELELTLGWGSVKTREYTIGFDDATSEVERREASELRMGRKKGYVEFEESPPDDFDPANPYKDPVAMLEMREHIVREKWIQIEKAKIIREKLRWCYRIEGVNHLQKCRHLVNQYLESTRGIGWGKDGRHPSLHGPKVEPTESE
ncbi:hypothetical protein VNO77_33078 [Canavalia gladiata]|uniref:LOB domain-containing protein n=2 Tax=NPAAA clade TaxID=2231382 RepID=A0AAN9PY16_CANGL